MASPNIINDYTFAVDNPCLKELWYVEYNAEEEDRDEVEADSPADRAGLGEVPVRVGVAHSAVPQLHKHLYILSYFCYLLFYDSFFFLLFSLSRFI